MKPPKAYQNILNANGFSLAGINPGSNEIALPRKLALEALNTLPGANVAVLGGDVLVQNDGALTYAYANWYCTKQDDESFGDYAGRSLRYALDYISSLALKINGEPLFVCVLKFDLDK